MGSTSDEVLPITQQKEVELKNFTSFFTSGFCIKKAPHFGDFSEHQKQQKQAKTALFSTNTKFLQIFYKR